MIIKHTLGAAFGAALLLQAPQIFAQDASPSATPAATASPSASPENGGGGGFRRNGGFAEFRERMNERIKEELKASDDEWAVIQPLLEKVQDAQMASMAGRFGGMRRFGGPGGERGARPEGSPSGSPAAQQGGRPRFSSPEVDALHDALQNENATPDDIKAKLQALRDARKKSEDDLQTARENLKKVLTLRQEAILVEMGVLD
ncbi:MAG TPA: hypothetical protein VHY22_08765 [Chthoniobacteraceae bacterium]|jgi:hypothetical protein|nr:hypothetical protein [Chthoniobacteraceae bacterium]